MVCGLKGHVLNKYVRMYPQWCLFLLIWIQPRLWNTAHARKKLSQKPTWVLDTKIKPGRDWCKKTEQYTTSCTRKLRSSPCASAALRKRAAVACCGSPSLEASTEWSRPALRKYWYDRWRPSGWSASPCSLRSLRRSLQSRRPHRWWCSPGSRR